MARVVTRKRERERERERENERHGGGERHGDYGAAGRDGRTLSFGLRAGVPGAVHPERADTPSRALVYKHSLLSDRSLHGEDLLCRMEELHGAQAEPAEEVMREGGGGGEQCLKSWTLTFIKGTRSCIWLQV